MHYDCDSNILCSVFCCLSPPLFFFYHDCSFLLQNKEIAETQKVQSNAHDRFMLLATVWNETCTIAIAYFICNGMNAVWRENRNHTRRCLFYFILSSNIAAAEKKDEYHFTYPDDTWQRECFTARDFLWLSSANKIDNGPDNVYCKKHTLCTNTKYTYWLGCVRHASRSKMGNNAELFEYIIYRFVFIVRIDYCAVCMILIYSAISFWRWQREICGALIRNENVISRACSNWSSGEERRVADPLRSQCASRHSSSSLDTRRWHIAQI